MTNKNKANGTINVSLCEGRHNIHQATDGSIFSNIVDPTDLQGMRETVACKLAGVDAVNLYATGLTVALVEVINFCQKHGVTLTLYHYNRDTGDYYPQEVVISPVESRITDIMHDIGIPTNINGYRYLRKAVTLSIKDPGVLHSITKDLYPVVAEYFHVTPGSVERAIRTAIGNAWKKGNLETIDSMFGYTVRDNKGKPTNSEFIALVADKIRMDC